MAGLLVFSLPLLVINGVRVCNDGLAIMAATWVILIGLSLLPAEKGSFLQGSVGYL